MKVFEFAKEIGMETIALMDKIREWDLPVKSHMASLDESIITEIKTRLEEKATSSKKKTKKKVAKKATKKKKAASSKSAGTEGKPIKKVAKKAVKKVAKKKTTTVVTKKTASETSKVTKKKTAKTQSGVIRRKAAHSPEAIEKAKEESAAQEAAEQELVAASLSKETHEETGAAESPETETRKPKRNIVGRMDLSQVRRQKTTSTPSATPISTGSTQAPRSGGVNRNIRTGFVAAPAMTPAVDPFESKKKEDLRKKKVGAGGAGGKEVPVQTFTASEFRKREVIFQPKKKRLMTGLAKPTQLTQPKASKRVVKVHEQISVSELAQEMSIKAPQLIRKLVAEGVMANMNTVLDFETVSLIVSEFGYEAENVHLSEESLLDKASFGDLNAEKITKPPVVTVMGHVDHGKTTLLDAIRNADVVAGEAGGITQHIGAYNVELADGKKTTFIDTPGHAAFTAMRARGAQATDVAIIVVAADDGMMPQTEEAISHAQAANVPIIVAINKMDRPNANPDKIKQQLADKGLVPEDWGGETIYCPVSALQKQGITELLEQVHLVAEVLELKANPKRSGTGVVIESKMAKGKGNVATILVQDGTLNIGDYFVAGTVTGRIRRMTNDKGEVVNSAGPGVPVEITGLDSTPNAGDKFDVCLNENLAAEVAELRQKMVEVAENPNSKMSLEDIFAKVKEGQAKELNVVLKSDVAGSNEAIKGMFEKIATDEVKVKIIHTGVGGISENDVLLAHTSGGLCIGFNVRPDMAAQKLAKEKGVEIKTYSIIYQLADDIKLAMAGMLNPDIVEEALGTSEVREIFSVPKIGVIAGCFVTDGKVTRNSLVRLVRDGRVVYEGKISSLKRFKDDAKEVTTGYECGIGIENYNDIKVGDIIEAHVTKEVAREL